MIFGASDRFLRDKNWTNEGGRKTNNTKQLIQIKVKQNDVIGATGYQGKRE
jgi:hypothetical protein